MSDDRAQRLRRALEGGVHAVRVVLPEEFPRRGLEVITQALLADDPNEATAGPR